MMRLPIHMETPHKRHINQAVEVLENKGLIIYPTDTVYGLGCNVYDKKGLERIYWLKGKTKFDPVSLIVKDIRQASQYARISNFAFRLLRHCLPGPYTFILPATKEIPKIMLTKRKEVGIRIPQHTVCEALLEQTKNPIVNTSVSSESDVFLNDPDQIEKAYHSTVDLMLDAGWLPEPNESTVVSLVNDEINILREGKGPLEELFQ